MDVFSIIFDILIFPNCAYFRNVTSDYFYLEICQTTAKSL